MDIYWNGQAMFRIKGKQATVIIDPFDPMIGLKLPKDLTADMVLQTHAHPDHANTAATNPESIKITGPGEYEVKGVAVTGVATHHDSQKGEERGKNTVYNIEIDGVNIVHMGDLGHVLEEDQVDEIGSTDILLIPVGGTYTIDAKDAARVVTQLEPKVVIPMHYKIEGLNAPLEGVDAFLKEMAIDKVEPLPKLTITKDKLPDETEVVVLNKS